MVDGVKGRTQVEEKECCSFAFVENLQDVVLNFRCCSTACRLIVKAPEGNCCAADAQSGGQPLLSQST